MRLLCCNKKSVNSFLNVIGSKKNLTESLTPAERLELVSLDDRQISLKRQCELLEVNRTSALDCTGFAGHVEKTYNEVKGRVRNYEREQISQKV